MLVGVSIALALFGHVNFLLLVSLDNGVHFYDEDRNDVKEIIRGVGDEKRKQKIPLQCWPFRLRV